MRSPQVPRPVRLAGGALVLTPLMAVLAYALTMLTRMLVQREPEPSLHLSTFWVWFAVGLVGIAVPILVHDFRRGVPRPSGRALPEGSRIWIAFREEEAGPVTRVTLRLPEWARAEFTLVRAHELEPAEVPFLEQLTDPAHALATGRQDSHELTPDGIAALTATDGTLRGIVDELIARPRAGKRRPESTTGHPDADLPDGSVPRPDRDPGHRPVKVPHGPVRRGLTKGAWALGVIMALALLVLLVWRAYSDAGHAPDIDDSEWAVTVGAGGTLVLPFVLWGWFGLMHLATMIESRHLPAPVARQAREDFWFFGLCSAVVMVFISLIVTAGLWLGTDGYLAPLLSLVGCGLFAVLSRVSLLRWRAAQQ